RQERLCHLWQERARRVLRDSKVVAVKVTGVLMHCATVGVQLLQAGAGVVTIPSEFAGGRVERASLHRGNFLNAAARRTREQRTVLKQVGGHFDECPQASAR